MTTVQTGAPIDLEVATIAADALRASIRVDGVLTDRTASLLCHSLTTHLNAGRRYLRLDLGGARIVGDGPAAVLADAHAQAMALGGMLVVDNARTEVPAQLAAETLFLSTPA